MTNTRNRGANENNNNNTNNPPPPPTLEQVKGRKVRIQALKYVVVNDTLYHRTLDGVLLKCLSEEEARVAMGEVHEGKCGAHQSAYKMR
jgi:hypothetical protein